MFVDKLYDIIRVFYKDTSFQISYLLKHLTFHERYDENIYTEKHSFVLILIFQSSQ